MFTAGSQLCKFFKAAVIVHVYYWVQNVIKEEFLLKVVENRLRNDLQQLN